MIMKDEYIDSDYGPKYIIKLDLKFSCITRKIAITERYNSGKRDMQSKFILYSGILMPSTGIKIGSLSEIS